MDNSPAVRHSDSMRSPAFSASKHLYGRAWLGALTLATSAVFVTGTAGGSPDAHVLGTHPARLDMSSKHHKRTSNHKTQSDEQGTNGPCLEGHWNVTSITLSANGLTFTGGAGTTVDIMATGNALGISLRGRRSWAARVRPSSAAP